MRGVERGQAIEVAGEKGKASRVVILRAFIEVASEKGKAYGVVILRVFIAMIE